MRITATDPGESNVRLPCMFLRRESHESADTINLAGEKGCGMRWSRYPCPEDARALRLGKEPKIRDRERERGMMDLRKRGFESFEPRDSHLAEELERDMKSLRADETDVGKECLLLRQKIGYALVQFSGEIRARRKDACDISLVMAAEYRNGMQVAYTTLLIGTHF